MITLKKLSGHRNGLWTLLLWHRRWLAQRRKEEPTPSCPSSATLKKSHIRPWSAGYAIWLLLKEPHRLSVDKSAALEHMLQTSSAVTQAYNFGQAFIRIVPHRLSKALDPWLEAAAQSDLSTLRNFAKSSNPDKVAVLAALTLPWSNGQVEGQVNRLKMIKRQMYGPANFDLLRRRVLVT